MVAGKGVGVKTTPGVDDTGSEERLGVGCTGEEVKGTGVVALGGDKLSVVDVDEDATADEDIEGDDDIRVLDIGDSTLDRVRLGVGTTDVAASLLLLLGKLVLGIIIGVVKIELS